MENLVKTEIKEKEPAYLQYVPELKKHLIWKTISSFLVVLFSVLWLFLPTLIIGSGVIAYAASYFIFYMYLEALVNGGLGGISITYFVLIGLSVVFAIILLIVAIIEFIKGILVIKKDVKLYVVSLYDEIKTGIYELKKTANNTWSMQNLMYTVIFESIMSFLLIRISGVTLWIIPVIITFVAVITCFIFSHIIVNKVKKDILQKKILADQQKTEDTESSQEN